jgi:hypothetical protein
MVHDRLGLGGGPGAPAHQLHHAAGQRELALR